MKFKAVAKRFVPNADFWKGSKTRIGVGVVIVAEVIERILRANGEDTWAELAVGLRQVGTTMAGYGVIMRGARDYAAKKELDLALREGEEIPESLEGRHRG